MSLASNKPLLLGVAAGVAVILVAGYLFAASKGVEKFEDFLHENDLRDAVRYRDVSYSPLSDTITMEDVDLAVVVLEFGGQQQKVTGTLDTLSIEGASEDSARRIAFSGYELVTRPDADQRGANVLYQFLDEPLKFVNRMGVERTRLDGSVAYDYDPDGEKLSLAVSLDADNIARCSLDVALSRAGRLLSSELSQVILASFVDPRAQAAEFGKVEFVALNADLEDYGFVERLMYLESISGFDYASALNSDLPFDAAAASAASEADRRHMARYFDEASVEALSKFGARGGDLTVSVRTERPVRFADLVQDDKLHRDIRVEVKD